MNKPTTLISDDLQSELYEDYGQNKRFYQKLLPWWYRLSSPPEPDESASLKQKDLFRRGRLASIIMLILLVLVVFSLPAVSTAGNPNLLYVLIVDFTVICGALLLNRSGRVNFAGFLVSLVIEFGIMTNIITTPGGLNLMVLPLFDLFVMPELLVASLLPRGWVFLAALGNSIAIWAIFTFVPHASNQTAIFQQSGVAMLILPLTIQIIVAVVSFLWVSGATRAIERADRAEIVSRLQHDLTEKDRVAALQKEQLEQGIQQLLQIHAQIANGNFNARAPLMEETILSQLSISLNMLLSRLQRTQMEAQMGRHLQHVLEEVGRVASAVQRAKLKHLPLQASQGGTPVDTLVVELRGCTITQAPQSYNNAIDRQASSH